MRKIKKRLLTIFALTAVIVGHDAFAADDTIVIRDGRRIQVDGFLLEWKRGDARQWGESHWTWDAVGAPDGIAGYFRPVSEPACPSWSFEITPPPEITAVDEETRTTEWLVHGAAALTVTAASSCGDTLPALTLAVSPPPASSSILYTAAAMAFAAALTAVIVAMRRRRQL